MTLTETIRKLAEALDLAVLPAHGLIDVNNAANRSQMVYVKTSTGVYLYHLHICRYHNPNIDDNWTVGEVIFVCSTDELNALLSRRSGDRCPPPLGQAVGEDED